MFLFFVNTHMNCHCRAGLEEELDMLRVQAAMDRATVKEVRLHLTSEHKGELEVFFIYFF